MAWAEAKQAGFVLAALLAGDRELLSAAGGLDARLLPPLQARWLGAARPALEASHDRHESAPLRVAALRELAERVRPPLAHAEPLPPRGRALVAELLPREPARTYVREAPTARAGFEADPGLVRALVELARRGAHS
jgi:hypothetical protein